MTALSPLVTEDTGFLDGGGVLNLALGGWGDGNVVWLSIILKISTTIMQVHESSGRSLRVSASRCDVKLWDASKMERGCAATWENCRGGCFSPDASTVAAAATRQNSAYVLDVATHAALLTMDEAEGRGRLYCFGGRIYLSVF